MTLVVFNGDKYEGKLECTTRSALGNAASEEPSEEGLVKKIYRLGLKERPDGNLMVAARPNLEGGKYTYFTPEGSVVAEPAEYFRTHRNW